MRLLVDKYIRLCYSIGKFNEESVFYGGKDMINRNLVPFTVVMGIEKIFQITVTG